MFCITFANAFKNERYAEKQKQSGESNEERVL